MRLFKAPMRFFCLLMLTGCFQRDEKIYVKPDGSGLLEIRSILSGAFLQYAETHAGLPPERIWFHEEALSHAAALYGENLMYLDHRVEPLENHKVFIVRYTFEKISDLSLEVNLNAPFLFRPSPAASESPPPRFQFEIEPGLLRILPPDLAKPAGMSPHVRVESAHVRNQRQKQFERERKNLMMRGNPFNLTPKATPGEIIERLGQGMHLSKTIILEGRLRSGNARYITTCETENTTEITLFSFSGDKFIQSEAHVKRLSQRGADSFDWHELNTIPGVKIDTGDIIILRFYPD